MLFPYNGPKPENLTQPMIIKYALEQVKRFEDMLTIHYNKWTVSPDGRTGIRPEACREYRNLWYQVLLKNGNWDLLSPEERNEVVDCFFKTDANAEDIFEEDPPF